MTFSSARLGVNINPRSIKGFGLDIKPTIETIFDLPFEHARIPIPFDTVSPKKGVWDFSETDWIIEQAKKHNKTIHLQFGIKTIGWPEINIPEWLLKEHPELSEKGVIDSNPKVRAIVLDYLDHVALRYKNVKNLGSVHVENEPFSKRLWVSKFRYLSFDFYQQEVQLVRTYFPQTPFVQNAPFDTPEYIPYVVKHSDIVGLNVYPQVRYPITGQFGYWLLIRAVFLLSKFMKKPVYITEYQTAAWLNDKQEPSYPFTLPSFLSSLERLHSLDAKIVFLWDIEQVLWRAKNGEKQYLAAIQNLC